MSSPSHPRPDRPTARAAAFLLVMVVVLGYGPSPATAADPLNVAAVLSDAHQTALVVDLAADTRPAAGTTAVITVEGARQQAQLTPMMSDRLAVAFVIDTSTAGAAALPAWLSAAARFILEAPSGTQAAAIADTSPPTVISPPQSGPAATVRALSGVRAGGQRSTSDALTLAKDQFPASAPGNRAVVVYTSAADAGGESAADLGTRLHQAATVLIVVGGAGDNPYWSDAARRTGGFFAPAGPAALAPALDQVATTLRGRYLVQFPTPQTLPARVSVRVDTGKAVLTGDAVVPAPIAGDNRPGAASRFPLGAVLAAIAACLVVLVAAVLIFRNSSALRDVNRSAFGNRSASMLRNRAVVIRHNWAAVLFRNRAILMFRSGAARFRDRAAARLRTWGLMLRDFAAPMFRQRSAPASRQGPAHQPPGAHRSTAVPSRARRSSTAAPGAHRSSGAPDDADRSSTVAAGADGSSGAPDDADRTSTVAAGADGSSAVPADRDRSDTVVQGRASVPRPAVRRGTTGAAAQNRASLPGAVVRGRASVPGPRQPPSSPT